MKRWTIAAATMALTVQGCTPIIKEARYPGGYPGYLLDKRTFYAARSKSLILLRANIILAMAARMATAGVHDGKDADAFADYLAGAAEEINYAAANLYGVGNVAPCIIRDDPTPAPTAVPPSPERVARPDDAATPAPAPAATPTPSPVPKGCSAYYANFESDLPLLEARITRLMLASLPAERARSFLQDIQKGNVLGAAWNALRAVYDAAGGLHRATGVYRSGLEVIASTRSCTKTFDPASGTVLDAAECLGLPPDRLFSPADAAAADNPALATTSVLVKRDAFNAVMLIAETACARLPINSDGDVSTQVAKRNAQCDRVVFAPAYRPVRLK